MGRKPNSPSVDYRNYKEKNTQIVQQDCNFDMEIVPKKKKKKKENGNTMDFG